MLRRFDDWPLQLEAVIDRYKSRKFQWGASDCGTFTGDCIEAMTGKNLYSEFSGQYTGLKGFTKMLRYYECEDVGCLFDIVAGAHGIQRINPRLAQRGDVCLYANEQSLPSLGVCTGLRAMFHTETGLLHVLMGNIRTAWKI